MKTSVGFLRLIITATLGSKVNVRRIAAHGGICVQSFRDCEHIEDVCSENATRASRGQGKPCPYDCDG
jgi:hypothetical protein